jgi:hypothetical protein
METVMTWFIHNPTTLTFVLGVLVGALVARKFL